MVGVAVRATVGNVVLTSARVSIGVMVSETVETAVLRPLTLIVGEIERETDPEIAPIRNEPVGMMVRLTEAKVIS
jgi:hypothetical protein